MSLTIFRSSRVLTKRDVKTIENHQKADLLPGASDLCPEPQQVGNGIQPSILGHWTKV